MTPSSSALSGSPPEDRGLGRGRLGPTLGTVSIAGSGAALDALSTGSATTNGAGAVAGRASNTAKNGEACLGTMEAILAR